MTPTLKQLRVLAAIAEHSSFTRASRALNLSQPSLTASINELERNLGVSVLHRNAQGAVLTEYGTVLVRHARTIANVLEQADSEIRDRLSGREGSVRIGATPLASSELLPRAVLRLAASGVSAALISASGDDVLIEMLETGEIDIVVSAVGVDPPRSGLSEELLMNAPLCVAMAPEHPAALARDLSLSDLRDETWALPSGPGNFKRQVEALFIAAGEPLPFTLVTADSLHMLKSIVQCGHHITILPHPLISSDEKAGLLISVPLRPMAYRKIGMRTLRAAPRSQALALLQDHLRSSACELQSAHRERYF